MCIRDRRYIVFHEFTHILDTEMYAKQDSWKYMALSGYTEYHAAQVELMICLLYTSRSGAIREQPTAMIKMAI